jgi:hypothetical protein
MSHDLELAKASRLPSPSFILPRMTGEETMSLPP